MEYMTLGHAKLICCCSGSPGGKVGQVGRQNKTKMNIIKNKFGISCLKIVRMSDHFLVMVFHNYSTAS